MGLVLMYMLVPCSYKTSLPRIVVVLFNGHPAILCSQRTSLHSERCVPLALARFHSLTSTCAPLPCVRDPKTIVNSVT